MPETGKYYKVLNRDGTSINAKGFAYSLPTPDGPGGWHEIPADKSLAKCNVGFHLTRHPFAVSSSGHLNYDLYEAEYEGEVLAPYDGYELVCRKVRIVRKADWMEAVDDAGAVEVEEELAKIRARTKVAKLRLDTVRNETNLETLEAWNATASGKLASVHAMKNADEAEAALAEAVERRTKAFQEREKVLKEEKRQYEKLSAVAKDKADSPAFTLLRHVWKHVGNGRTNGDANDASWRRVNDAMQMTLSLAVSGGFRFASGDFKRFSNGFNSPYWLHIEQVYADAIGATSSDHGGNPSAVKSIEAHLNRKPFLVVTKPGYVELKGGKVVVPAKRLYVGVRFFWHVDLKTSVFVKVTSFVDGSKEGRKPPDPYVVACSYKEQKVDERGYRVGPNKIDRTFKITHAMIAEYHKALRDALKKEPDVQDA